MTRLLLTGAPPMIAGSASSGSGRLIASWRAVDAASAVAARPTSMPARRSIPTANALAVGRRRGRSARSRSRSTVRTRPGTSCRRVRTTLAVQLPERHVAGALGQQHQAGPRPVQVRERAPRREDRNEARQEQVQGDRSDDQERAAAEAGRPLRAAPHARMLAARRDGVARQRLGRVTDGPPATTDKGGSDDRPGQSASSRYAPEDLRPPGRRQRRVA